MANEVTGTMKDGMADMWTDAIDDPDAESTFKRWAEEIRELNEKMKKSMEARASRPPIPSLANVTVEDMPTVVRATTLAMQAAQRGDEIDAVVRAAVKVVTSDREKVNKMREAREEKRRAYAKQLEMDRKRYMLECEALAAERDKLAAERRALTSDRAATVAHAAKLNELDTIGKEMKKERAALQAIHEKITEDERKRVTEAAKKESQIGLQLKVLNETEQNRLEQAAKRDAQSAELERNRRNEAAKERKELDKLRKEMILEFDKRREEERKEVEKRREEERKEFEKRREKERKEFDKRREEERNEMKKYRSHVQKLTQNMAHMQQALTHLRIEMAAKAKVVDSPRSLPQETPTKIPTQNTTVLRSSPRNFGSRTPPRRAQQRTSSRVVNPRTLAVDAEVDVSKDSPQLSGDSNSSTEPNSAAPSASPKSRAVVTVKRSASKVSRQNNNTTQGDAKSRSLVVSKPRRMSEIERLKASLATARWVDERELERTVTGTKSSKSGTTDAATAMKIPKKRTRGSGEEQPKGTSSGKKKKRRSVISG